MIDYDLSPTHITAAGKSFISDMQQIRAQRWVNEQTRMIIVETTLANYNLQCYAAVQYLVEITPSGALIATRHFFPFLVADNASINIAEMLDIVRGIFIIGYILLIRVYYETKWKVSRGKKGLEYVFSFFGFLDQSICATYIALICMRLFWEDIPDPKSFNTHPYGHYFYTVDGFMFTRFFIVEAVLLFFIIFRWCSFMTILQGVHRFWQTFGRSALMFLNYLVVFVPLLLGMIFLANTIWHPYVEPLSRWGGTSLYLLQSIVKSLPVTELSDFNPIWTLVFLVYFVFSMTLFFINGFLAITVWSYFEVMLLDDSNEADEWTRDKALDYMLWGSLYRYLTGNEPGSSFTMEEGEEDEDEDDGDDDEDDDGK